MSENRPRIETEVDPNLIAPCPFCHGQRTKVYTLTNINQLIGWVGCLDCGANGPSYSLPFEEITDSQHRFLKGVVENWNRCSRQRFYRFLAVMSIAALTAIGVFSVGSTLHAWMMAPAYEATDRAAESAADPRR